MDLDILVRNERAHPGPTCNYLASNRNNYGDIPFSELVALALRVTLPDLQRSQSVKGLAEIASEKQYAAKEGFLKAFFKYCKALKPQQQAAALFEGAIHLVEKSIEDGENLVPLVGKTAEDREHWVLVSRAQLHWLQFSNSKANGDSHSHDASNEIRFTAVMAHVDGLERTIGPFLRVGLHTSSIRKKEGSSSFTKAARLYMAPEKDMDFKLEIWIGFAAGMAVSQLISAGEDLGDVLGDYLYKVTKLPVQLTRVGMDYKLEMTLGFVEGTKIHALVFP
ncbi:hypothetical protein V8F33_013947 [Rhypophila sp. PSN 637]